MILKFLRLVRILAVFTKYGLDEIAVTSINAPRTARLMSTFFFWRRITSPRAIRLRQALEELGPIFVKFGQVLSTRRDLMPQDIADELALLQDETQLLILLAGLVILGSVIGFLSSYRAVRKYLRMSLDELY